MKTIKLKIYRLTEDRSELYGISHENERIHLKDIHIHEVYETRTLSGGIWTIESATIKYKGGEK